MILEKIKSDGLASLSYFLGSENEAVVIDPRRDIEAYLNLSNRHDMTIVYILETHKNEDYVTGSRELETATGAKIYHGSEVDFEYGNKIHDGEFLSIGDLTIKALHTPGHSPESKSYVVYSEETKNQPLIVFTGDVLFVGDTGRTDFYPDNEQGSKELYDSLWNKLLPLGDDVIILPAHGSGSVCGSHISSREISTIGLEKKFNPSLQLDENEFIKQKSNEYHEYPPYFRMMEKYNLIGQPLLKDVIRPKALSISQFKKEMEKGALVVDTRQPESYNSVHIPGALNIWLGGLNSFAGWFIEYDRPILLVMENDSLFENAKNQLYRVGYDKIIGYLKGGTAEWYSSANPVDKSDILTVHDLNKLMDKKENEVHIIDVRGDDELKEDGFIPNSQHIYAGRIKEEVYTIPRDKKILVYCTVGLRSSVAASVLRRKGFNATAVLGSFKAWKTAGYPVEKVE